MSTCWSSIKWSVAFLSGCPLVLSGTRSRGFLVTLSHDKAWLCFFPSDPALLCPGPQSLWGWARVTWPTISAHAQRGWLGQETYRWRMRSDTQSGFLCVGRNVWIPRVSQVRTQTASCAQVSASSPTHPTQLGPRDQQLRGSPQASFQLVPGGRAWGCVSCPPVLPVFQRQGTWPRFTSLSICCVWNLTGTGGREGGPTWSLWTHRTHSLAALLLWLEAPRPGISSRAAVQGSSHMVQEDACVASTQTVVDLVDLEGWYRVSLQKSRGHTHSAFQVTVHTHFSQMGRKVQCHGHLLCLPFRASAAQTHTHMHAHTCLHTRVHAHTHIHTCMHMHMGMHTPPTYNTQSRFRGWELLVSQCANCFSLLSPWISQQESDVSIV